MGVGRQRQRQSSGTEDGLGRISPFDQSQAAVLHQLAQTEVGDLPEVVEPVDVGMEQRPHSGRRYRHLVLADEREGGAGDRLEDSECPAESLGEGRLPRPEVTGKQQHVARHAQRGHGFRHLTGSGGRR